MKEKKQSKIMWLASILVGLPGLLAGCPAKQDEVTVDLARIKRALPSQAAMSIDLPTSRALVGEQATFYRFTREITWHVNGHVAIISGLLEEILEYPPTTVLSETSASWGPFQDALSPATWRLIVEETAAGEFRYVVEGWPKGQPAAARPVLTGTHVEGAGLHQGHGQWSYDLTAGHGLDPITQPAVGTMAIRYDMAASRDLEVTFTDVLTPGDLMPTSTRYHYVEAADGSGVFDFISNLDVDADQGRPERPRRELVQVRSRWLTTGQGRADVVATLGDLPQGQTARVAECWDQAFVRTFVEYEVAADRTQDGEAVTCAFADRQAPEFENFDPAAFADADYIQALPVAADFESRFAAVARPVPEPQQALYYKLTQAFVEGVTGQVQGVLDQVNEIVLHQPTACSATECSWGPWTDPSSQVQGRMTITRLPAGRFAYRMEALPQAGGDWQVLFQGETAGQPSADAAPAEADGWFVFDLDVLATIQPAEAVAGQFRAEFSRRAGVLQVAVRFDQVVSAENPLPTDLRYVAINQPDGSGALDLRLPGNVDDAADPAKHARELLENHSRWQADGAGVSTVRVTGGDLGADQVVLYVQCWDATAALTYEKWLLQELSNELRPALDGQACVYGDWVEPSFPALGDEIE